MSNKSIYEFDLHEFETIDTSSGQNFKVLRVPGGWIYYLYDEDSGDISSAGTFVRYDNGFYPEE